ncbi:MAG: hypothetical protein M1826_002183 [Phylliscum demangeonii]|nr:MAG: hypothetical protein M1826_002183 [Phylliscum demangeonii]
MAPTPPAPIPGYHYDAQRGKYFKIVPQHLAPAGAPYSREAIQQRATAAEKKRRRDHVSGGTRPRPPGLRLARALQHPLLAGIGLGRETGGGGGGGWTRHDSRRVANHAVLRGLRGRCVLALTEAELIRCLAWDPRTGGCYLGVGAVIQADRGARTTSYAPPVKKSEMAPLGPESVVTVLGTDSEITSITACSNGTVMCTTLGRDGNHRARTYILGLERAAPRGRYGFDPYPHLPSVDLWTLAEASPARTGNFALGSYFGVTVVHSSQQQLAHPARLRRPRSPPAPWPRLRLSTPSDVMALAWLAEENAVVVAGRRDGAVVVLDVRCSAEDVKVDVDNVEDVDAEERTIARLRHPSCVTHVRQVDRWRVVVNGLESSLRMYDLRFPGPCPSLQAEDAPEHLTRPVRIYDHHAANEYRIHQTAFDLERQSGLMAIGREDGTIRLVDIWTGQLLVSLPLAVKMKTKMKPVRVRVRVRVRVAAAAAAAAVGSERGRRRDDDDDDDDDDDNDDDSSDHGLRLDVPWTRSCVRFCSAGGGNSNSTSNSTSNDNDNDNGNGDGSRSRGGVGRDRVRGGGRGGPRGRPRAGTGAVAADDDDDDDDDDDLLRHRHRPAPSTLPKPTQLPPPPPTPIQMPIPRLVVSQDHLLAMYEW